MESGVHYRHYWRTFFSIFLSLTWKNRCPVNQSCKYAAFFCVFFLICQWKLPQDLSCLRSYGACNEWHWYGCPLNQTDRLSELYGRQTHSTCWHLLLKTSSLPLPNQRSMARVLYCANGSLLSGCRQPGSLGLWYFILTDRFVTVNFAPMLLIWLAGSIEMWRIDLMSFFFEHALWDRLCVPVQVVTANGILRALAH